MFKSILRIAVQEAFPPHTKGGGGGLLFLPSATLILRVVRTSLMTSDKEYDIILDNADPMQINRNTSRKRPIRVIGSTTTADDDDDDDSIADDESMPPEFRCPIMQMPMSKPVIAADGHSYEKKAIERWLLTKNTSPVTGKALAHAELTLNHNL